MIENWFIPCLFVVFSIYGMSCFTIKISLSNKLKTIENQKVTLLKKLQSVDSTSPCYLSRKEWHLFQLSDLCTQEHEPVYINLKISMESNGHSLSSGTS